MISKNIAHILIVQMILFIFTFSITCSTQKGSYSSKKNDTLNLFEYPNDLFGLKSIESHQITRENTPTIFYENKDSIYPSKHSKKKYYTYMVDSILFYKFYQYMREPPYIFRDYMVMKGKVFCFDSLYYNYNLTDSIDPIDAEYEKISDVTVGNKKYKIVIISNFFFSCGSCGGNHLIFLFDVTDINHIQSYSLGYSICITDNCFKVDAQNQTLYFIKRFEGNTKDTLRLVEIKQRQLIDHKDKQILMRGIRGERYVGVMER